MICKSLKLQCIGKFGAGVVAGISSIMVATTALATPFEGIYQPAGSNWTCNPADVGMDGGALAVKGNAFHGVENVCELSNPTAVRGMDAVLYDAECSGEGESYSYRVMILRNDAGIYVIQNGYASDWQSCR